MKSLIVYIIENNSIIPLNEKIKDLPDSVKGLIVFVIYVILLIVNHILMSVYKKE